MTRDLTAAVDAAMIEMQNVSPPLRRSDCARLIRAALSAPSHGGVDERAAFECICPNFRDAGKPGLCPIHDANYIKQQQARATHPAPSHGEQVREADHAGYVRAMKEVAKHFRLASGKPGKGSLWALHQIRDFSRRPISSGMPDEQRAMGDEPATLGELVERFALQSHPDVPWRELFAQMRAAGVLV
jgi:hypothetical protein